ncbi:PorT family protein [Dyadobacter sp. CY261]|uniref:outer membrane beta-barrel protein n=1 Tax=Dyadobacter sp. CY261 TaxID=2907203 RepID=UPI001F395087|nr:outer membrane beta-barrel protein [Dyadobacter sp. CY261]MCF0075306.1 PorT family protein [Dyadobacter sp. CY261]
MMKNLRIYLVIILVISPDILIAQTQNSLGKFSIGITFEPNYGYRTLNFSSGNKLIAEKRNANEVFRFGYALGMELKSKISKNILLSYGLQYLEFGYNSRFQTLKFANANPEFPVGSKTDFFHQVVGIPLSVQYHFTKSRFNPYIIIGVQLDCILQKTAVTVLEYEDGRTNSSEHRSTLDFQRFPVSALLGAGMEYRISDRISMVAEPLLKRSITSLIADRTAKEKPYSVGLAVKIVYKFKR